MTCDRQRPTATRMQLVGHAGREAKVTAALCRQEFVQLHVSVCVAHGLTDGDRLLTRIPRTRVPHGKPHVNAGGISFFTARDARLGAYHMCGYV